MAARRTRRSDVKRTWTMTGAVLLAALAAGTAPAAPVSRVDIREFAFAPAAVTVPRGTTVTWVNHDEEPHTITSAAGVFGSTGLGHEETFAQTFGQRGTYSYFCALHPHMRATVIVE